jgi:hypothetical protein
MAAVIEQAGTAERDATGRRRLRVPTEFMAAMRASEAVKSLLAVHREADAALPGVRNALYVEIRDSLHDATDLTEAAQAGMATTLD